MKTIIIDESLHLKRLDEALVFHSIAPSRSKIKAMIEEGKIVLNGKVETKVSKTVMKGDTIQCEEYEVKPLTLEKEDIPLDVIYEDDYILIINKPAGLVVHPGNGHNEHTLVNALLYHEANLSSINGTERPGLVHRIDKDTSGLLAIAKTDEAYLGLAEQLKDHSMHREYFALVKGIIYEDDGKIDAPIAKDDKRPGKFKVNVTKGKESVTFFHVEKRYPKCGCTLISCRLLTGRTHQIRVHMDYIGHPVIGDPLYGEGNRKIYDKGQLLHAYRLTLVHPITKKEMTFVAPRPSYFEKLLSTLE